MTIVYENAEVQVVRIESAAGFTEQYIYKPGTPQANLADIAAKARAAIAANTTYLGIATPTNAQVVAQVARLTRECTAIIKLLLDDLADTSGT